VRSEGVLMDVSMLVMDDSIPFEGEWIMKGEQIMKARTVLCVTLLAIIVSMLVSACFGGGRVFTSTYTSRTDFNSKTTTELHQLEVDSRRSSNSLNLEMNLDVGQVVFRLSSPDGQVQWQQTFTAPVSYRHAFDLDVTPGMWSLTNELKTATGDYHIEWKAR
jgi:hypothetical protein